MTRNATLPSLAAIFFALTASGAIAQQVPKLDISALCKAEAKAAPDFSNNCMVAQTDAREKLIKQWAKFPPADRASCTQMVTSIRNAQSYVELLTCLEMKQDLKGLPKE